MLADTKEKRLIHRIDVYKLIMIIIINIHICNTFM